MRNLIKKIQNDAFESSLWQKGSRIVLGISGGPDSSCLAHVLMNIGKKYDFKLYLAHVNYQLRGKESDLDEQFVIGLGKKYNIPISVLRIEGKKIKSNVEEKLRIIRYDFFEALRKDLGFDCVAVAHNMDDQAETVLMRILRGTGLSGISAMKMKRGNIIRPLLDVSRKDIETYLKENKLNFRIDSSNGQSVFTRNKIRNELLPYLERNFDSSMKEILARWSKMVAEDYVFIEGCASKISKKMLNREKDSAEFSADVFLTYENSLQNEILRQIHKKVASSKGFLAISELMEIKKIISSSKKKNKKSFVKGLNISKKGDIVRMLSGK